MKWNFERKFSVRVWRVTKIQIDRKSLSHSTNAQLTGKKFLYLTVIHRGIDSLEEFEQLGKISKNHMTYGLSKNIEYIGIC